LEEFERLQNEEVNRGLKSVLELINRRLQNLDTMVHDWSAWDDTYNFMLRRNQEYIASNLGASTLANLQINFMLFIDDDGEIVYEEFYDDKLMKEIETPSELEEHFKPGSVFLDYDEKNGDEEVGSANYGIIMLEENPMLICSRQILKSDESGPPVGSLVWGYYLDKEVLYDISKTLNIHVDVHRLDKDLDPLIRRVVTTLSQGLNTFIEYVNSKEVRGYVLVEDYYGTPSLLFELSMPPAIYNQGLKTFYYIMASGASFGIVIGLVFILYLDKVILFRLQKLSQDAMKIGKLLDTSKRVEANGSDEISMLANEINVMLDSLDKQKSVLEYYATHDVLTGVLNRRSFEDELKRAISKASRGAKSFLMFLDIDNFKLVNDSYRHAFGDKVLITISQLIKRHLRKEDIIARFSGDEFLVLFEQDDLDKARVVAERLRQIIHKFNINLENNNFNLTVSIGLIPVEETKSPDLIIANAYKAMFQAKEMGRNRIAVYEPEKDYCTDKFSLLVRIREALEQDGFKLFLQPIIDIENNKVAYYEALLRLPCDNDNSNNDGHGMILPDVFIPLAEDYGLIDDITFWVVSKVIKILKEDETKCIFVNLSSKSLVDSGFLEKLTQLILESGVEPDLLGFEITESSMLNAMALAYGIKCIKELGCKFAIDDFGTGFSSYGVLSDLPVDFFKIDGSIIRGINTDFNKYAIVKSIKLLADLLGKKTVAEWVEDQKVAKAVKKLEIDYAQGFYYGVPQPVDL
ncbi:MAG: EAL domain-containing protein, partial [Actinobacteria bacterium]|nr:EAL domain-containing protein [Actinomycetota bacterium]